MTTLEKIRAEIMNITIQEGSSDYVRAMAELYSLKMKVISIIDKYAEQEPTSPCDLCKYNPPSSCDGKPCTMCPAEKGGE